MHYSLLLSVNCSYTSHDNILHKIFNDFLSSSQEDPDHKRLPLDNFVLHHIPPLEGMVTLSLENRNKKEP